MRPLFYKRGATFSRLLEYAGAALGLLGAALLASHTAFSPLGWFSFAASNLLLIGFAVVHRHRGLLVLQLGFMVTSCMGITNALRDASLHQFLVSSLGLV
jgi:hypothetical protein